MNRAILIGRLTKEPELRATASGVSVCTFSIAVDRRFKQQGQPDADFIPIVVWRGQAESCAKYLGKGSQVAIAGSIQTRSYDAPDGAKRYITEVIADEVQFMGSKANGPENSLKMAQEMFEEQTTSADEEDILF
jgi:single-strand DNA-binding protein